MGPATICSICPSPWCKFFYCGQFQATNVKLLNLGLGRGIHAGSPSTGYVPKTPCWDSGNSELAGATVITSYPTQDTGQTGFWAP